MQDFLNSNCSLPVLATKAGAESLYWVKRLDTGLWVYLLNLSMAEMPLCHKAITMAVASLNLSHKLPNLAVQ